ncbi:HDOD domain-containing protein [Pseudoxanthomonas dokdonensis]|uniref:Chemotaxis protein CheY n=1 Tax=Pseudoxanthomonas dokdonensis TaxID=344882 RepID=A0A0R0CY29_9GAMM|nr:HDOD domain-containing protein [Pseudoxanthomonas dokdonensis]KRG71006.1 chemotaxis protein CheY [Pseudoxanthomonas dokdonensis]
MRILYVGEVGCLPADLGDYLGDMGDEWKVEMVADGNAAIFAVANSPIDVVITGPTLPDLPPSTLLGQIRTLRPETIRIALMEGVDSGSAPPVKLIGVAHRFLPLPLASETVLEAIHSLEELRDLLDSPRLRRTIGRVEHLPSPPHLYFALTRALEDDEGSSHDIAKMVAADPAIAAKVLQLCNSAYFSNGRAITDLRAAVTRLGLATLRDLVLASEVFSIKTGSHVDRAALQSRALLASRLAAKILPHTSSELGATAALLADIGLLLPGVRNERDAVVSGAQPDERPGHTEAGAYLLGLWGLPMPIVEAVAFHRQPQRSSLRSFWVPGAVHVAGALASNEPVDEAYLSSLGVLHQLPMWREMAESMSDRLMAA